MEEWLGDYQLTQEPCLALPCLVSVTSTTFNYYTGLIETSKTHFYGRAAAELSFSEGILRTFTGVREAISFSHCNTT